MNTPRELRRRIEDIQDDLVREHGREAWCEYLHREFGFDQTPMPEDRADSIRESLADVGMILPPDSIKLTVEHDELHTVLRRVVADMSSQGADAAQLVALMLTIGRRIGMAEASQLLAEAPEWDAKSFGGSE